MNKLLEDTKKGIEKAIDDLEIRLQNIRAGRANPAMVDHIMVDYYGTLTELRSLAAISVPEAKELKIKPFDRGSLAAIEKAIMAANLGIMPTNNGDFIILNMPALTEETRKGFVKEAKEVTENGKIAIRNVRQKALKDLEAMNLSEDDVRHAEKRIQELINDANHQIEIIFKEKEKDLMTI